MRTYLRTNLPTALTGVACLFLAASAQASGVTLGAASGFNVFTFSNFTPTGSDTLGKVAVGGDFTGSGYLVGSNLNGNGTALDFIVKGNLTDNYFNASNGAIYAGGNATLYGAATGDLYVAGTLSTNNGSLTTGRVVANGGINAGSGGFSNSGNIYTQGNFTASYASSTVYAGGAYNGPSWINHGAYSAAANPLTVPVSPIDFTAVQTSLGTATNGLSNLLANTASNGTLTVDPNNYGLTLTGTDSSQVVFSITADQLNAALSKGFGGISVNAPASATVIINVTGTGAVSISGSSIWLNGPSASQILFNFPTTSTISFNNFGMTASVLAPNALFNGLGGQLNGELIANSVTGVTEFHNDDIFSGTINVSSSTTSSTTTTTTPEPATWLMALTAVVFGIYLARKRFTCPRR